MGLTLPSIHQAMPPIRLNMICKKRSFMAVTVSSDNSTLTRAHPIGFIFMCFRLNQGRVPTRSDPLCQMRVLNQLLRLVTVSFKTLWEANYNAKFESWRNSWAHTSCIIAFWSGVSQEAWTMGIFSMARLVSPQDQWRSDTTGLACSPGILAAQSMLILKMSHTKTWFQKIIWLSPHRPTQFSSDGRHVGGQFPFKFAEKEIIETIECEPVDWQQQPRKPTR